jgi:hypothetical protein
MGPDLRAFLADVWSTAPQKNAIDSKRRNGLTAPSRQRDKAAVSSLAAACHRAYFRQTEQIAHA